MQNWLKLGDYNAICDSCGRKFKASMMLKRWDGLFVCKEDWEVRHPQLNIRVRGDIQKVPTARPEPIVDTFLTFCYVWGVSSFADLGTADCMQADNSKVAYQTLLALQTPTVG